MRTLRSQCLAATMAAAFVIGLGLSASAQDKEAEAKRAAEAKKAGEARATAEDRANADARARRGVRPGDVQKVFTLKHVRVDDMARVLSVFPAEISGMERGNLHVLSVSAAPAVVAAIEETIKRLDVPLPPVKSVELTAYVLECSPPGDGGNVPTDLQDVVGQLKRTFNYSGCGLGRTLFSSRRRWQPHPDRGTGRCRRHLALNAMVVVDSSDSTIRLNGLNFQNMGPPQQPPESTLRGDVAIRDGQKVVLGRLGSTESGKHQIVVLAAKLVP